MVAAGTSMYANHVALTSALTKAPKRIGFLGPPPTGRVPAAGMSTAACSGSGGGVGAPSRMKKPGVTVAAGTKIGRTAASAAGVEPSGSGVVLKIFVPIFYKRTPKSDRNQ